MIEMGQGAIDMVGKEGTAGAARLPAWAQHEMIDDELMAAIEPFLARNDGMFHGVLLGPAIKLDKYVDVNIYAFYDARHRRCAVRHHLGSARRLPLHACAACCPCLGAPFRRRVPAAGPDQ